MNGWDIGQRIGRKNKMGKTLHRFGFGNGEFDEVFVDNAFVHVERMNTRAWWIGITPPKKSGLPRLMINTGIHDGEWYFNIEEDSLHPDAKFCRIARPACHRKHVAGKAKAKP